MTGRNGSCGSSSPSGCWSFSTWGSASSAGATSENPLRGRGPGNVRPADDRLPRRMPVRCTVQVPRLVPACTRGRVRTQPRASRVADWYTVPMAERVKRRRHTPSRRHLDAALRFLHQREQADLSFEAAVLAAAQDGWSMREIGAALGMSASTVWRIVDAVERGGGAPYVLAP